MHQLTHLAADVHQRLAHAGQERPVERLLALGRRIDSSSPGNSRGSVADRRAGIGKCS
jgi:hypothetical protein